MFRKQGRIKKKHRQQNFIAELFRGRGQTMFNGGRQIRIHYYQKDERNEVTYDVPNFNVYNIFECGRNNPDVSYERAHMATSGNE